MLRRSFRSSTVNAASAVSFVLVLSGACARATHEDVEPPAQGGQFTGAPSGGTSQQTGGTLAHTGGVSAPRGGTAAVTGGLTGSGGSKSTGGVSATGGKASGGSTASGGSSSGGKASASGGSNDGGEPSSAGAGDGGASVSGGRSGGSGGGGGSPSAKGGSAGIVGNSADCDFEDPACTELSCANACPTTMGAYCADSCQAVIDCIDDNPSCGTEVDPMCVRRNGGTAAKCTGFWESASGAQTPIGLPAQTAITFFNCACGGVLPPDTGGDGGAGGGGAPGAAGAGP